MSIALGGTCLEVSLPRSASNLFAVVEHDDRQ